MPSPEGPPLDKNDSAGPEEKDPEESCSSSSYERLMHSLHHDSKWLQEVNLGRRVGLYKFRCKLGSGNFSQVKLAIHQLTKERVAIKIVDKGTLDDKMMRMLNQEISTMESLHHPNLIRLYEVVETYSKLYLVMEYASGGELYNRVTTMGKLEEIVARNLFAQICSAVSHMHKRHIIHRDIKAENVFFSGPNRVKLGDFGFSAQLTEGSNQRLNTFCGSPPYAAPELFCDENYLGGPVDIWALGILLYFMVVGRMPFKGQNVPTLKINIIAGVYNVPNYLSKECADLIGGIIQQNPMNRLTISSILSSDWLKGMAIPSFSEANQSYNLAPTIRNPLPGGIASDIRYSAIEQTARERLQDLGITSQLLEAQHSQGSRSHVIGAYRIVVHRVQKQLSSFVDVEGFESDVSEKKKEADKKPERRFLVGNFLSRSKARPFRENSKADSKDDLFLNCWRRKVSDDGGQEEDSYEVDSKDGGKSLRPKGKRETERLSPTKVDPLEKSKLRFLQNRSSSPSKEKANDTENSFRSPIIRSTTCSVL